VAPASATLTFGSKTIPSATYSENNGTAVVTVNSAIPVIASFSSDGRTITISPTSAPAQNATAVAPGNPASPVQLTNSGANSTNQISRRYFAVVDASHGGDDHGEM
jgi:N-acetylmuramoyl-L-alanine amidase